MYFGFIKLCHPNRPRGDRQLYFIIAYHPPGTLVTTVCNNIPMLRCSSLLLLQTDLYILGHFLDLISSDFCILFLKSIELCTLLHSHEIDHSVGNSLVKVPSSYA